MIAAAPGPGKVLGIILTAMLFGDNVLQMKYRVGIRVLR
jgi:hypothetical protein